MKNRIVSIKDLNKTYESSSEKLTVLNDFNLNVDEGSRITIVGESGNGKSTFLNILGGIDKATSGEIVAGSYNLTSMDEEDFIEYRAHFVGLVFQFHYLLKDFTALENVFLPAYMAGVPKKIAKEKALGLIESVGLIDRKDHLPSELSGGERQRIAVARSLINDPSLILADEPTGNLDPTNAAVIGNLLFSIAEKFNKTLILVTHDINLAAKGDHCYKIENGKLVDNK